MKRLQIFNNNTAKLASKSFNYPGVAILEDSDEIVYLTSETYSVGDILYTLGNDFNTIGKGTPIAVCVIATNQIASSPKARIVALKDNTHLDVKDTLNLDVELTDTYAALSNFWEGYISTGSAYTAINDKAFPGTTLSNANKDYEGKLNTLHLVICEEASIAKKAAFKNIDLGETADHTAYPSASYFIQNYKTEGTLAGDWYIPSAGELSEMYKNIDTINTKISSVGGSEIVLGTEYRASTIGKNFHILYGIHYSSSNYLSVVETMEHDTLPLRPFIQL